MPHGSVWQFHMLGHHRLLSPDGETRRCERKPLAVLSFLALEGPTSRSRMAGLLWPETQEGTARNNLVQLLRRMKQTYGENLVRLSDPLELGPQVRVELPLWFAGTAVGADASPLLAGDLLDDVDFDGMPDLEDWLLAQRERVDAARTAALVKAAQQFEAEAQWAEAIGVTQALLAQNALSEDHYRRLMRLQYLSNDRTAALQTYQRCRQMLWQELRVEPMPVTTILAQEIEKGSVDLRPQPKAVQLPLAVQRPPVLVGRSAAWQALEEGWRRGQFIVLAGVPGVGKSRLMHDFVAAKGKALRIEARPGDMLVPYSTTARNLQAILVANPHYRLNAWQRRALAPLLPQYLEDGDLDLPNEMPLNAVIQDIFQMGVRDVEAIVYEDMQYADLASIEAGLIYISSAFPLGRASGIPHMLCTVRTDELNAGTAEVFRQMTLDGLAVQIELPALGEHDVSTLLRQLDVPLGEGIERRLVQFAGGNPLYLLETVRNLIENGTSLQRLPDRLPVPERVSQIIERRLGRLSTGALNTARAASILQSDFSIELVSEVLGAPLFDVARHWEELEAAQIMTGGHFAHDLIYEAILMGIPDPVLRLFHRSAARALLRSGASKARIAIHWHQGGVLNEAAPLYVEAAQEAFRLTRLQEARHFIELAAQLFSDQRDRDQANTVRRMGEALMGTGAVPQP